MKFGDGHITEISGYRLTDRIGSGGMGDVYKAYNAALDRWAAVKILHKKEMAERFRNEAYIQSSVSHPNIANLYEYQVTGETACIIMEYVEGETLDGYLHRKGRIAGPEAEQIVGQVASALAYLHSRDILHRDIKPQNFKIQPGGKVTMLDFGIAKNKYSPKLTQQGFIVGTAEYMAPEQFQQQVDKKSDVWSLGVLTYELVTGFMPFEADNPITMRHKIEKGIFTDPAILVPGVSVKIRQVIEKSLRPAVAQRSSAAEIAALLGNASGQEEPAARMHSFLQEKKKPLIIAGALLTLVLIIVVASGGSGTNSAATGSSNNSDTIVQQEADVRKLTIDVPNAPDAMIVFPDGSTKKLPYEIVGKEGENFRFTLQAEGYLPRMVEVPITSSQRSYQYNLEKIEK
ncbi:MAG TPA: serine/threonine-protein kinase [Ferruginibacter sp.]|nr:hypothetical protein [Chitinophagaceae bacterium]HRI25923.1 serine/threonine-protein kinase [Ferruginibacter sp.]